MGRKTYDSIGKTLLNRRNIVITRNTDVSIPGCEVVDSIEKALSITKDEEEIMVIGGANLFEQLLPEVNKLYITRIEGEFEGETYFPHYDENDWLELSCESHQPDEINKHAYHFITFKRK